MKKQLTQLMRSLEAYVREETASQHRIMEVLTAQQEAVVANEVEAFHVGADALQAAARAAAQRATRRGKLVRALAEEFGVAAPALTLRSIAERAGTEGQRLRRLHGALADITRQVDRKTKQVHALARMHERLFVEVIQTVLGGAGEVHLGGQLVDAQV